MLNDIWRAPWYTTLQYLAERLVFLLQLVLLLCTRLLANSAHALMHMLSSLLCTSPSSERVGN
jgi:hypothetical protein